jgi:hypothetical protein
MRILSGKCLFLACKLFYGEDDLIGEVLILLRFPKLLNFASINPFPFSFPNTPLRHPEAIVHPMSELYLMTNSVVIGDSYIPVYQKHVQWLALVLGATY